LAVLGLRRLVVGDRWLVLSARESVRLGAAEMCSASFRFDMDVDIIDQPFSNFV
jgi:hypothetical protein